ncbi:beta-ketoacyl synthase N-terminal-like domain-containing protein [Paenibacillus sonchi]|uniref:beta-ketoacyl synthase N-terminal-like domain-containing protein n=1 Tax=Paenibacillus sonchi TaxID=373687 RepID=UPI002277F6CA|nr:beta-ketoacyl synthase N-terminal-like domain-containing protein [Paenibacillus sonchi]
MDTACSSSAVALHRAVLSLQAGECRLALAGGVNLLSSPRSMVAFDKAGMLSKTGRCRTFDKQADGFVRGKESERCC